MTGYMVTNAERGILLQLLSEIREEKETALIQVNKDIKWKPAQDNLDFYLSLLAKRRTLERQLQDAKRLYISLKRASFISVH